jgi:2-iminobutanoate/2-iminopropanoate deaminase
MSLPISSREDTYADTDTTITSHEVSALKKPLDHFNYALSANGFVFVSCVQGFIPGTLQLVSDEPGAQAKQVLQNLRTILEASGSSMEHVVKFTLILRDMNDFPVVNDEINAAFPRRMPARTSIQAIIPKGCKLAIEAIAVLASTETKTKPRKMSEDTEM